MPESSRRSPHGIVAFGSASILVAPDIVTIEVAVIEVRPKPADAFAAAKKSAAAVSAALSAAGLAGGDVRMAAAQLSQAVKGYGETAEFVGYRATIAYRVLLRDPQRLEAILTDAISAGANRLERVTPTTTRMAELRADARRKAVATGRAKAELYADAAGVSLGVLLHLEDHNPAVLNQEWGHGAKTNLLEADAELTGATPPGNIEVAAAVTLTYAIAHR